jgi:hypothetical protein
LASSVGTTTSRLLLGDMPSALGFLVAIDERRVRCERWYRSPE